MTLKITAIGNLTRDSQLRTLSSGETVLNFSIARNDRRTKEATYIECAVWGKLGQSIAQYLLRGKQVYVDGELGMRKWEGQNGPQTSLTCRVREIEILGGGQQGQSQGQPSGDQSGAPSHGDMDDEIPF